MNRDDGQQHEAELRDALQHRADDVDVTTDFAPGAIARQRRTHRSRVALGGVACVAAIAVAVPVLWGAGRPQLVPGPARPTISSSTSRPSAPARSTAPTAPSTNPSTPPSPTGVRPSSPSTAAQGAPATTPSPNSPATTSTGSGPSGPPEGGRGVYAIDNVLRLGPATITLPRGRTIQRFARLQGGAVVASWNGSGNTRAQVLDPKGRELVDLGENSQWVVSRDRARVAWSDGQVVQVLDGAGKAVTSRRTALQPIDIVGDDVYLAGTGDQVVVDDPQEWNLVTGKTRTLPKNLAAVSPSRKRGLVVYPQGPDTQNRCWALVDLTSTTFNRLLEKCPSPFVPRGFSANGTYLIGDTGADGGFFDEYVIARADTGKVVFGGRTSSSGEGAGWSMHLDADEQTLWLSANTSTPRFPATTNSVQRCTIGGACSRVTPSLKTPQSQPRYVVEGPSSD